MRRQRWINLTLVGGSLLFGLALFEGGIRLIIQPSDRSWGRLAGLELPPLRVLRASAFGDVDRSAPWDSLVVDGQRITMGDLGGLLREDEELGYAPLESARSVNGWWQSNALGARSRTETPRERLPGTRRVLVFGESFTAGSRVRQEESWPYALGRRAEDLDVVNLAVDGYGMGQAFLRYRQLRDRVDHDVVVLGFVPRDDLIRDVNTLRALIGWESSILVPRFVLEGGRLRLVPSPYRNAEEIRADAPDGTSPRLLEHLRRYDAAYFPDEFSVPPVLGRLVAYKVVARLYETRRFRRFNASLLDPGSEALRTARAIFEAMAAEVTSRGQRFVLVTIPNLRDVGLYRGSAEYRDLWSRIVAHCPPASSCVDLLPSFPDPRDVDQGFDRTHYGPRTNAWIADRVWEALEHR